ncbi:MAG TPA: mycofactocin biosynthesis chaperone MftB [Acidimicrobiales bacterium]|nr:mycofactocin biosynthesis chaperone MftB [Acidimicrobiales bacterium]
MTLSATVVFDATAPWRLNEQVSVRDESFGALAYHHGTRRLVFLKSRELVEVVRRMSEFDSADAALEELVAGDQRARYLMALTSLVRSEILCEG